MQSTAKQIVTVLKDKEERRFEEFFFKFSRNGTSLNFADLITFAFDRSLVQNKTTFSIFLKYFDEAVTTERALTKPQFNFLLTQLSAYIFHNDRQHLDKLLSEILSEKTTVTKESNLEVVRQIIYDENNKKLLQENAIRMLSQYEPEMKNIFTIYMQENLSKGYIMLNWYEIAVQNKRMNTNSFVRFVRDAEIVPHILSIEQLEELMMKIIPPVNNREYDFYQKSQPVNIYEKNLVEPFDNDPQLSFHEFQLLLAKIALEIGQKEEGFGHGKKIDIEKYFKKFFSEMMLFRINISDPLPNLNRKLIRNLDRFTEQLTRAELDRARDDSDSDVDAVDRNILIQTQQHQLLFTSAQIQLPYDQILRQLDKELPPVPVQADKVKEMAKWDPDQRVIVGPPKPVSPSNKASAPKPANKPKQQQRRKAGEPEPRKIIYEEKRVYKTSEQHIQDLNEKLKNEEKIVSDVAKGSLSDIQVAPVLIQEILYPPNTPQKVQVLIEAAINSHNESNYVFALQNYDEARKIWVQLNGRDLTDGLELYFEFCKGQIYESAGRDDLAIQAYLNAKAFANKLPTNNPDKALAFCGLGSSFYNTEEYEWALRSYLKAREYRENIIGIETVDTATVFNNLGCCMFMLERNKEAFAYFKLAHAILDAELGQFHTRTLTAARNISKSNHNWFENEPEYKKLWVAYAPDQFAGGKKKKKKGKK